MYLSLVLDKVPLLLIVVGDKNLGHQNLLSSLLLLLHLSLSSSFHPLFSPYIKALPLILIIALALLQKCLLSYSIMLVNQ